MRGLSPAPLAAPGSSSAKHSNKAAQRAPAEAPLHSTHPLLTPRARDMLHYTKNCYSIEQSSQEKTSVLSASVCPRAAERTSNAGTAALVKNSWVCTGVLFADSHSIYL